MITLVIYDISNDRERLKISKVCRMFGLNRIQRSAFLGNLSSSRRKELTKKLKRCLKGEGNIQIFVICKPDFSLREVIGDVDYEEDEILIV